MSVILAKYSSKLEADTDKKVWVFCYIWSMHWYIHCMLDYLLHVWLSTGERRFYRYYFDMFHAKPLNYMTSMEISEAYNVFRTVSGRKRFSLYKSPIDFATFIDISVVWFIKFNLLARCMPKNLVTEASLIVLLPTLISGKFTFLLYENSMYLVLSALMLILFDFSHLSRHFSSLFISSAESRGRIIKTLVKLQCSAPCISSYNMKATTCQQCCKSGSSKIYKFIVGRLYVSLRRAHCSQHMATYNM